MGHCVQGHVSVVACCFFVVMCQLVADISCTVAAGHIVIGSEQALMSKLCLLLWVQ